jgi:hypothetical protein
MPTGAEEPWDLLYFIVQPRPRSESIFPNPVDREDPLRVAFL